MKKFYLLFVVLVTAVAGFAQSGEITGRVTDETGEGAIGAVVAVVDETGKVTGQGVQTDFDGFYAIKPLTAGKYNLKFTLLGYTSSVKTGIVVTAGNETVVNTKLAPSQTALDEVIIEAVRKPLIDPAKTSGGKAVTKDDIGKLATRNITDVAATAAGAFQQDAGKGISIGGAREDGTEYYIDGVKVIGKPVVPQNAIQELTVLANGIPAEFGDATGGIINISTSGPADKISGGVEVLTSQFLDGFGYNLVNANLSGPIVKSKKGDKKPILGFFAAFEYLSQKDRSPSAIGAWKVSPSKLDSLRQFPLIKNEVGGGFNLASENLTMKDMYKVKAKPNNSETNFRGVARIDFKPHKTINMSVGGTYVYQKYHDWVDRYTLLNYENNPLYTENNWRVYGRFNQSFVTQDPKEGEQKKVKVLRYIGYSLQFDYEKNVKKYEDESHGFNPFNYGYIGKFDMQKAPLFRAQADTFRIQDGDGERIFSNMIVQQDFIDTGVVFTPGTINPFGTRYTEQFFELGGVATDLNAIQSNKALINGQRADLAYNLWFNTGRQFNGFGYDNFDEQYRGRAEVNLDLKPRGADDVNRHSIKIGVELEQRVQRRFQFSPLEIWFLSRQLMNRHITGLDYSNPIFVLNDYPGQQFSFQQLKDLGINPYDLDTILFRRAVNDSLQTNFDKNVRAKIGASIDSFINIDALDPSFFNLDMFSAEEILNNNSSYAFYRGFDYKGNVLTSRPKFFDFYTKTDANGVPLRQIDAFRPFYAAAYISDKFRFKDLTFNIGLRVDRYDANQYVLKDQYSLYRIKTIGETSSQFSHPTNLDADNTFVYLKNSEDLSSGVAGYRSGNKWYDAFGNELATGAQVAGASASGAVTPYLAELDNIKDINEIRGLIKDPKRFKPEETFTRYKPQWVVMPRLQFSFVIADRALFYAHYDVLSQRPQGSRSLMEPTDWLYFDENISTPINNPNLKPERTIDFELGFQQAIGSDKAGEFGATATIAAYYREFRDQVQIKYLTFAYPKNYITYDNIDFGTVKGFKLDFDMRRIKNFKASANYTMQFAEGTGSDDQTQQSLALGGYDNLRTISPLGYDSRHTVNLILDYSFSSGKEYDGPVSKTGYQILANTGINFNLRARSGTPYTSQANVTPEALNATPKRLSQGSINGSRLPWNFRVDMRVYKGFDITVNKNKDKELQRTLNLQIYLQIQNLLNGLNPINVYRYTGNPDDDGYLNSTLSQASKDAAFNPQSYVDLYRSYVNNPDNYSLPRRISLGFQFNF